MNNVKEPKTRRFEEMVKKMIKAKIIKGEIKPLFEDFDLLKKSEGQEVTIIFDNGQYDSAWKQYTKEQFLKAGYSDEDSVYDEL